MRIEQLHGAPQDIEWAIDRSLPFPDNVFLLQSRPETAWFRKRAGALALPPAASAVDYVLGALLRPAGRRPGNG